MLYIIFNAVGYGLFELLQRCVCGNERCSARSTVERLDWTARRPPSWFYRPS